MARFMVKASEYKNVCKAVNDRKLAELKKEIIEILKKQDEKEIKKAIDYFNSQELHYTHLEKSFIGKWIEKAGYGVGTVRIWKGKKYKKIAPGKWARVFDKEGRGTNIAIGKLIARVQKIDNVEDLMAFVMQNKQRFVDENGIDLPVLDKLRAAVDARNGNVGSKETKNEKAELKRNPFNIREMARSLKFDELIPEYEKQKKILNWDINKKKKEIERNYDFSDFSEEKKSKFLAPKFENLENQYTAAKDNLEYIKNELKRATERDGVNDVIEKMKKKGIYDEVMGTSKLADYEKDNPYEMTEAEKKGAMKNPKTKLLQLADAVRNTEEGTDEYYTALSVFQNAREEFIENQGMAEYKEIMPDYPKGKSNKSAENKYKGLSESELQKEVIKEFDNLPKENKAHGIDYYIEKIKNNNNQLYETINERFDDKARDFFIDAAVERMTRKDKKKEKPAEKKEESKQANRRLNEEFLKTLKGPGADKAIERVAENIDTQIKTLTDDNLSGVYARLTMNLDKYLDKKTLSLDSVIDKNSGATLRSAYMHTELAKRHPEVVKKVKEELEKRGISVKKSLFDDFIVDVFEADDEEELGDELYEGETEYNDYSAEQPELFNSTSMMVQEAFNRCNAL